MFPRWLSWVFLFTMGYVIYSASQMGGNVRQQPASPVIPPITAEQYPALAEITDVEAWKRKLNPDYASVMNCSLDKPKTTDALTFKLLEDVVGTGAGANCGDEITLKLTVWNSSGGKAFTGEVSLALGSRQLASGLDYGLQGLSIGATRTLLLPPYALVRAKNLKGDALDAARKALPTEQVAVVTAMRVK